MSRPQDMKVFAGCTAPKGGCGMGRRKARPMECDAQGQPVCFCGSPGRVVRTRHADFSRTREALQVYDAAKPSIKALWELAMTNEEVEFAQKAEKEEADKVREAFFLDTQEVNSRDHAMLVSPNDPWLRNLVAKYNP